MAGLEALMPVIRDKRDVCEMLWKSRMTTPDEMPARTLVKHGNFWKATVTLTPTGLREALWRERDRRMATDCFVLAVLLRGLLDGKESVVLLVGMFAEVASRAYGVALFTFPRGISNPMDKSRFCNRAQWVLPLDDNRVVCRGMDNAELRAATDVPKVLSTDVAGFLKQSNGFAPERQFNIYDDIASTKVKLFLKSEYAIEVNDLTRDELVCVLEALVVCVNCT
jgi:hypothetical protein